MGIFIALGLLALSTPWACGFPISSQETLVYDYESEISSKADFPSPAASRFALRGRLTIKGVEGGASLQLSDLTTNLYNGAIGEEDGTLSHFEPLSDAAAELKNAFIVYHNEDGTGIRGLSGLDGATEWTINIKRAIASLLLFDTSRLDNHAFVTKEDGLYGPCDAEYSSHREGDTLFLRRYQDHRSCAGHQTEVWTNVPPMEPYCSSGLDPMLSSNGERIYAIEKTAGGHRVSSVNATAAIYIQPYKARGELMYISTRQTLFFVKSSPSTPTATEIPSVLTPLAFDLPNDDFTQGRDPLQSASAVAIVRQILDEIVASFDSNIGRDPSKLHDERVPQALYFLSELDREPLEELYNSYSVGTSYQQQTARQVFMQMLPMVGSTESILLIRDLLVAKTVTCSKADDLMQNLPFFIREPSEELLRQCEVFMDMPDGTSETLKGAGILAFATMVHKAFATGNCSPVLQEAYVQKYLHRFQEATDYNYQMMYLEGLSNLEDGRVFDYLEPVIKSHSDKHLRFLAVWATMNKAFLHADAVYKLYWPILSDRTSSLEMRVAALTMLVVSRPTAGRFFSIHWFMSTEPEPRLRHFYYTTLQSLANSKDPCYTLMSGHARQVLRLQPAPAVRHWATGNYVIDHANTDFGFGGLAQLFLIANPRTDLPNVFFLLMGNHAIGHRYNQFSIYLKLEGISNAVKERLSRIDPDTIKIPQLAEVLRQVRSSPTTSDPVHFELLVKRENRVTLAVHLNHSTFHKLADVLATLRAVSQDMHFNIQLVETLMLTDRTITTDIGLPALFVGGSTSLASLRGNYSQVATASSLTFTQGTEIRTAATAVANLMFYNPVLDVYQAVQRSTTFRVQLPFQGSLGIDTANSSVKFSVVRKSDAPVSVLVHVRSAVFVRGETAATELSRHCPTCKTLVPVTKGNQYRQKEEFLDVTVDEVGAQVNGELFDCEHHNGFQALGAAIQQQNYQVFPASRPVLIAIHLMDCWLIGSPPGSCGTHVQLTTTSKQDSEIAGAIQFAASDDRQSVEISLEHKTGGVTKHAWHVDAVCQHDNAFYNFTLNVIRDVVGADQRKLCMQALVKFPTPPKDKLRIKASEKLTAEVAFLWSASDGTSSCGGEPAEKLPVTASFVAETTAEQVELANAANTWPFSACAAGDRHACHRAAAEMATLRKYSVALNYSSPLEPALFFLGRGEDGQLVASVEVSASRPVIYITVGADRFTLDTGRRWLEPILINTRYPALEQAAISLGVATPE